MSTGQLQLEVEINELTNPLITFEVQDEHGVRFQPQTLTLTLYDRDSLQLLGMRPVEQDVFNAGGVIVQAGAVAWQMTTEDNRIINDRKQVESHIALFSWTWFGAGGVVREQRQEILIMVRNLAMISSPAPP